MGFARKDVERTKMNAKKFVRYQEGAEKYSLGLTDVYKRQEDFSEITDAEAKQLGFPF